LNATAPDILYLVRVFGISRAAREAQNKKSCECGNERAYQHATFYIHLCKYGIERMLVDVFLWGGYRYSNARDALAAAKRNPK